MPPRKDRYAWIERTRLIDMEIVHLILAVVCFIENTGMVNFEILASLTEVPEVIARHVFYNGRSKLRRYLEDESGAQKDAYEATTAAPTLALQNAQYASIKGIKLTQPEIEHLLLVIFCIDETTGQLDHETLEAISPDNGRSPRTHFYKGRSKIKKYFGINQAQKGEKQAETDKPSATPSVTDVVGFEYKKKVLWASFLEHAWEMWFDKHAELQNIWGFSTTDNDLESFWVWYKAVSRDETIA